MSVLSSPWFHNEAKAFADLESIVWASGVVCPHCGVVGGRVYDLAGVRAKASGRTRRASFEKCGECREQFTVKVGTVFEYASLPLRTVHLLASSKRGIGCLAC